MSDTTEAAQGTVLRITDAARGVVIESRAGEANATSLALFVEISGERDGVYTYDMWFEDRADAAHGDAVNSDDELAVVVLASSVDRLHGATLDVADSGLVIINPNTPARPVSRIAPESDLSSPVEIAVLRVLDDEINPQIAMHGGRADLIAVTDGIAYLRLSGGCQGCGLAAVTLSQGISVAIKEAVPEISDIVDVTAHEEGTDPYFQGAKK